MLFFDDADPMECFMRGGICFPLTYEWLGQYAVDGYAVMAGQDVKTGKIYIFEEISWLSIDDVTQTDPYNPDAPMQIEYQGLSHWLNKVWSEYFAGTFYWNQDQENATRMRLDAIRSPMVQPKPRFVELPPYKSESFIAVIWVMIRSRTLKIKSGTILEKQLEAVKAGERTLYPAVHALGCCLLGLERYPWRPPYKKPEQEILIPA